MELAAGVPEELPAGNIAEWGPEQSEEEIRRELQRVKEERESLARIVELRRLESLLEARLGAGRQSVNGGGPSGDLQ
jgi:hypothetical protein